MLKDTCLLTSLVTLGLGQGASLTFYGLMMEKCISDNILLLNFLKRTFKCTGWCVMHGIPRMGTEMAPL